VKRWAASKTVLASAPLRREQARLFERPGRPRCGGGRPKRMGRARAASSALSLSTAAMRTDPNTHAFVVATALLTSICFAIFAMNLLALVLSHVLT
jgi:hypothetical protein